MQPPLLLPGGGGVLRGGLWRAVGRAGKGGVRRRLLRAHHGRPRVAQLHHGGAPLRLEHQ